MKTFLDELLEHDILPKKIAITDSLKSLFVRFNLSEYAIKDLFENGLVLVCNGERLLIAHKDSEGYIIHLENLIKILNMDEYIEIENENFNSFDFDSKLHRAFVFLTKAINLELYKFNDPFFTLMELKTTMDLIGNIPMVKDEIEKLIKSYLEAILCKILLNLEAYDYDSVLEGTYLRALDKIKKTINNEVGNIYQEIRDINKLKGENLEGFNFIERKNKLVLDVAQANKFLNVSFDGEDIQKVITEFLVSQIPDINKPHFIELNLVQSNRAPNRITIDNYESVSELTALLINKENDEQEELLNIIDNLKLFIDLNNIELWELSPLINKFYPTLTRNKCSEIARDAILESSKFDYSCVKKAFNQAAEQAEKYK